ncbi:hypothetical protein M1N62_01780 [Thermodesulfovibrionales bacterium]|nr:hypothetical protein [Thermodesulfovibrionales bacterium]MCL0085404.1 hypothetical protein [Thermodesulfovibrionales bacterium]
MKFNRNKTGLVVVAMILALTLILSGCATPAGNTDNKTPDFLKVGSSYGVVTSFGKALEFTVVEIKNAGWILAEVFPDEYLWINPTQLVMINERPQ